MQSSLYLSMLCLLKFEPGEKAEDDLKDDAKLES